MIGFSDEDDDEDSEGAYGIKMHPKPGPIASGAKLKEADLAAVMKDMESTRGLSVNALFSALYGEEVELVHDEISLSKEASWSPTIVRDLDLEKFIAEWGDMNKRPNKEMELDLERTEIGDEWGAEDEWGTQYSTHKSPARLGPKDWSKARRADMVDRMKLKGPGPDLLRRCFSLCSLIQRPSGVPLLTVPELDTLVEGMDMLLRFILLEEAPPPKPAAPTPPPVATPAPVIRKGRMSDL